MYSGGGGGGGGPPGKSRGFGFGGFSIGSATPAAPVRMRGTGIETQMSQMGATGMPGRSYGTGMSNIGKRRVKSEEEYFDDDDDGRAEELEYQPAPDSPVLHRNDQNNDSDSDDPLESFMAGIENTVKTQEIKKPKPEAKEKDRGVRDDIEGEDELESYMRYMEENPNAGILDDEENVEYDEDGNPITGDKKIIDPLPDIDHHEIEYEKVTKNFYEPHPEISSLTPEKAHDLRNSLGIKVSGIMPPHPVSSFPHFQFDEPLMKSIRKSGYTQPTPIQAQGIPIGLSGRDIIGIAKTGSGKTAAFIWPLLVHIMDQKPLKPGDGPIGLICAPTRELSQQIYQEAKKFGKVYNIKVVCAYGGGNMWEQVKACEECPEIIVCTPGRLIDLVRKKATNLLRCTYLVYDEADRMFDLGFEPQVRSIANHVRPDRQTMLFSATFRKRVEKLARDILTDPIRVVQGDVGEANEDVTQIVKVIQPGPYKWNWLINRLVEFTSNGSVLIFVTRKANCIELADNLKTRDFKVGLMHGDMSQGERNEVIGLFKKKGVPILVATDVAARGLDIPHIRTVVNYDVARDIDTHTHRIGRTGRAGTKGTAYTLVTLKDKEFTPHLVRNLEGANQYVPDELLEIAMQCSWFKSNRYKKSTAKRMNVGGQGLGFRERPGLGSAEPSGLKSTPAQRPSYAANQGVYSRGPQSDRLSTMKAAFKSQFQTSFVSIGLKGADNKPIEADIQAPQHGMLHGSAASQLSLSNQQASRSYMLLNPDSEGTATGPPTAVVGPPGSMAPPGSVVPPVMGPTSMDPPASIGSTPMGPPGSPAPMGPPAMPPPSPLSGQSSAKRQRKSRWDPAN